MEQNEITTNDEKKVDSPKTDNPTPPVASSTSSTSSWWSGFITQAKEKVGFPKCKCFKFLCLEKILLKKKFSN
jgi:hypothetical protein